MKTIKEIEERAEVFTSTERMFGYKQALKDVLKLLNTTDIRHKSAFELREELKTMIEGK